MKVNLYFLWASIITLLACQPKTTEWPVQDLFQAGVSAGIVDAAKLDEASGMVESINNPNMLWAHNDSGNAAEVFLIDKTGNIKTTVHFPTLTNRDWEEVAVATGADGKNYLYIGEIGDNKAVFDKKYLYRIEEPVLTQAVTDTTITEVDTITFQLADGARDTEAFMIDPLTDDFYIFSKREENIHLYKFRLPQSDEEVTANRVIESMPFTLIVGADISPNGTEILIKSYNHVYYWKRSANESVEAALRRNPVILPYTPEPQGESICFDRSGAGYYTLSEQKKKMPQHLYFYKRK